MKSQNHTLCIKHTHSHKTSFKYDNKYNIAFEAFTPIFI